MRSQRRSPGLSSDSLGRVGSGGPRAVLQVTGGN